VVAYRTGDRLSGVLGVGVTPKALRGWRQALTADTPWHEIAVNGTGTPPTVESASTGVPR